MKNGIKIRKVKLYLIFTKDNKNIATTTLYCSEQMNCNNRQMIRDYRYMSAICLPEHKTEHRLFCIYQ